ncbi:MAG: transglycosylase domain-containing protein [Bacteroidaceae bacterium]|jgi:penicillin-binding protein 1A
MKKTISAKSLLRLLKKGWEIILSKLIQGKKWYASTYRRGKWYQKALMLVCTLFVAFLLYLFMVDINFLWLFGKSPSMYAIAHPKQAEASVIYSADGKVLGHYFRENRIPVEYEEISPMLIQTLICTEDERFYKHFGIDFPGLLSATKDIVQGNARGASTITQQLVKNMFKTRTEYSTGLTGYIPGIRLLVMKTKEWISAVKIEMHYSKEEILTMYLNTVDFGSNAYGIKTAAKTYFKTTPAELKTEEGAVLVGLLKATTYYNPHINPENSLERRNVVLRNLYTHNVITKEQCDSLCNLPLKLNYNVSRNYDGSALYFREAVASELKAWCQENNIDLYAEGLKIYTTLDSRMQRYAEAAVRKQMKTVQRNFNAHWGKTNPWQDEQHREIPGFIENLAKKTPYYRMLQAHFPNNPDSVDYYMNLPHKVKVFDYEKGSIELEMSAMDSIRYMERFMHCGFVAMEPGSGHVKAWVGDISFNHWKYDKVTARRQPGSTFKLFVYTTAMNQGFSPCETRTDEYAAYDATDENGEPVKWAPHNANGVYSGAEMSLKTAFARSVNTVAVALAQEVGIANVARTAHAMGIQTPLQETPSLALGASDVSLLELVNSYCTVVNDGMTHDPILVTRIEDRDGKILYEQEPRQTQAIPYESAFLMQQMLLAGMKEPGGTSQALWGYDLHRFNTNFGGKTGTTSNHSDAWYVGVTRNLVAGAWVGGEYRSIHFRTGALGQGSRTALPVFAYFMEQVLKDPSLTQYRGMISDKPKQPISRDYNCSSIYIVAEKDSILGDSTLTLQHLKGVENLEDIPLDPTDEGTTPDESESENPAKRPPISPVDLSR